MTTVTFLQSLTMNQNGSKYLLAVVALSRSPTTCNSADDNSNTKSSFIFDEKLVHHKERLNRFGRKILYSRNYCNILFQTNNLHRNTENQERTCKNLSSLVIC